MNTSHKNHPSSTKSRQKRITVQEAKARLPISALWEILKLAGDPAPSCSSPFRIDRNPSFSIYENGTKWHDHATGEGGDVINFLGKALNLDNAEAVKQFMRMAYGYDLPVGMPYPPNTRHLSPEEQRFEKRAQWPAMRSPSYEQCEQIAATRGLRPIAIQFASEFGCLRVADLPQGLAYIFKSSDGTNAQARLIIGANFAGAAKTKTLPGSRAAWPIGIPIGREPYIALCEGGPDFLAAFDLIVRTDLLFQVAPVAMLGAAHHIPADALSHFTGKRVRIFTHDDDAGRTATERWSQQLSGAGAEVDSFSFAGLFQAVGVPMNDLNDFLCMPAAEFAKHAPAAVSFATEKTTKDHESPASSGTASVLQHTEAKLDAAV